MDQDTLNNFNNALDALSTSFSVGCQARQCLSLTNTSGDNPDRMTKFSVSCCEPGERDEMGVNELLKHATTEAF